MHISIVVAALELKPMFLMQNYYNAGHQLPSYYANAAPSRSPGFYYNYYPYYAQYAQNNSTQGFRIHQYPQTLQYPYLPHYLPQQYRGIGVSSVPTSPSAAADVFTGQIPSQFSPLISLEDLLTNIS